MARANSQRILVAGLGKTGWSCVRYLRGLGEQVSVTDSRTQPPMASRLQECYPEVCASFGELDPALLEHVRMVVASPGLSMSEPLFVAAREQGIPVIGDIELFARTVDKPVAAVTGSNGKSTVTRLLAEMAIAAGVRAPAGANLGTPALDLLDDTADAYLLELSSFQLELTQSLSPIAAVALNVSADHMDRHASLEHYAALKARIYKGAGVAVINADDPWVRGMAKEAPHRVKFSSRAPSREQDYGLLERDGETWLARGERLLLATRELGLRGRHNWLNALAALAVGEGLGLRESAMLDALRVFTGLAHRCQRVAEYQGVTYYNDSKATNVGAAMASLRGVPGPVIWLAGGQGKQADFSPLRGALSGKTRFIILLGEDARAIGEAVQGIAPIHYAKSLEQAVTKAAALASEGDSVLFSPACASFDMFSGFAERGTCFETAVRGLDPCAA